MQLFSKDLVKSLDFEKKINCACSFNNAKCEFIQGKILTFEGANDIFILVNIKYGATLKKVARFGNFMVKYIVYRSKLWRKLKI